MTYINYACRARIAEALQSAEMKTTAIDDAVLEFEESGKPDSDLEAFIAEQKERCAFKFVGGDAGDDVNAEVVAAFGPHQTLKAQADFVRKYGQAEAEQMAARFGTRVGATKGGTVPCGRREQHGYLLRLAAVVSSYG